MSSDAATYHARRAMKELDLGLTATTSKVARAHLELASLHLSRARSNAPVASPPPAPE